MTYKGYTARIEFDQRDNIFTGKIIGIADNITFQGETVKELRAGFQAAIDHYIADCAATGRKPYVKDHKLLLSKKALASKKYPSPLRPL